MKLVLPLFVAATLAIPMVDSSAINIDGKADADYGSAISTQRLGTSAFDNTSTNQGLSNGSELDAAYGFVSNAVLYLVLAGNYNSDFATGEANDALNIFF